MFTITSYLILLSIGFLEREFYMNLIPHSNSFRAMCGLDSKGNCVHGPYSLQSAQREISSLFEEETGKIYSLYHLYIYNA